MTYQSTDRENSLESNRLGLVSRLCPDPLRHLEGAILQVSVSGCFKRGRVTFSTSEDHFAVKGLAYCLVYSTSCNRQRLLLLLCPGRWSALLVSRHVQHTKRGAVDGDTHPAVGPLSGEEVGKDTGTAEGEGRPGAFSSLPGVISLCLPQEGRGREVRRGVFRCVLYLLCLTQPAPPRQDSSGTEGRIFSGT